MVFRIRHKPTGRYLKKYGGAMWYSVKTALDGKIFEATTDKTGQLYATKKNVEILLKELTVISHIGNKNVQPDDWEIVEG